MRQRLNLIKLQIKTETISKCNKRETDNTNSIQYRGLVNVPLLQLTTQLYHYQGALDVQCDWQMLGCL